MWQVDFLSSKSQHELGDAVPGRPSSARRRDQLSARLELWIMAFFPCFPSKIRCWGDPDLLLIRLLFGSVLMEG